MCMIDDGDGCVTVLRESNVKARKRHKCGECFRQIGVGEVYLLEATVFDALFSTHKTCSHCLVARRWLLKNCSGFIYGDIKEDIREHCGEGYGGFWLGRIAVGMSWKWRRKNGSLLPVPHTKG